MDFSVRFWVAQAKPVFVPATVSFTVPSKTPLALSKSVTLPMGSTIRCQILNCRPLLSIGLRGRRRGKNFPSFFLQPTYLRRIRTPPSIGYKLLRLEDLT